MKVATFEEYHKAKLEIISGSEFEIVEEMDEYGRNHITYYCTDGGTFWQITKKETTEFWSTLHPKSRKFIAPAFGAALEKCGMTETRVIAINRLQKLAYWFANEMIKEEAKALEQKNRENFEWKYEKNSDAGCSESNIRVKVMKNCLKDACDAAEFLKNKENTIKEWQLAGVIAMFYQCDNDLIVPYDLPMVIKVALHI